MDAAEQILTDTLDKEPEYNYDNQDLYMRAASFFKALGNEEKAEYYQQKFDDFFEKFLQNPTKYGLNDFDHDDGIFDEFYIPTQQPIMKDKKIYPNDQCLCGSGNKYKKCCGRGN